jgi:O-antigen ligase
MLLLVAGCYAVLLTKSRAGAIGALMVVAMTIAYNFKFRAVGAVALVLSVLVLVLAIPGAREWIDGVVFAGRPEMTDIGRQDLWRVGYDLIFESPILGTCPAVMGRDFSFHNDMLQVAVFAGVPGLLLFILIISMGAWGALRSMSGDGFVAKVMGGALLSSMTHVVLQGGMFFWFLLSLNARSVEEVD